MNQVATFSVTQGSSVVQISSSRTGFAQNPANNPYLYYMNDGGGTALRSDLFDIEFADGSGIRLTDFNEYATASSPGSNVIGIPSSAAGVFTNSVNIIGGGGSASTFDIYDLKSGALLIDNYRPQTPMNGYFRPAAQFGYASGQLTLQAPRKSGFFNMNSIDSSGIFTSTPDLPYVAGDGYTQTLGTGQTSAQYLSGGEAAGGAGGTPWVFSLVGAAPVPVCFAEGTLILRADGTSLEIEKLGIGDLLFTEEGPRPIKWLAKRKYTHQILSIFPQTIPVRVKAGALGKGVPSSDLLGSRKHGLVIEGVEIGAETLCNGANITHCKAEEFPDGLTYYHIEFDEQEVLMANGCSNSSFVSTGNRSEFDNVEEYRSLYGDPDQPSPRKLSPYMWSRELRRIYKNTLLRFMHKECATA